MKNKKEEEKRDRRERFTDLSNKRFEKAQTILKSIAKLSDKSNYFYTEEDVTKLIYKLEYEVRATMIGFVKGSNSIEDRYKRLLDFDLAQLESLKINDPELYDYILDKKSHGTSALVDYLDERKRTDKLDVPNFLPETNELLGDEDLYEKIKQINDKLNLIQKKLSKIK